MNVLSLFDGMSCGRIALERAGIEVTNYYASEIDKYATKVSEANYPDIIRLGGITKWQNWDIDWSSIDLVTGGFPCQAWSMAGKQLGDKDERGMLFWTMLDVMKNVREHNPKAHFLIENVKMKKEFEEYITHHTEQALGGVHKILINSALVSAQNRNRYYWTSFPCAQPDDKGIVLADIFTGGKDITDRVLIKPEGTSTYRNTWKNMRSLSDKSNCLTASGQNISNASCTNINAGHGRYYMLTPIECERLQTVPDNYTAHVSNTQRYKMLGNGWTVDVIVHLLDCMLRS